MKNERDTLKLKGTDVQAKDGVRISKGKVTLENGSVYEGEWLNGMHDGHGKKFWTDGSHYEGMWS
jgi:hypothetical protein